MRAIANVVAVTVAAFAAVTGAQPVATTPDWKVGDHWRFEQTKMPGGELTKWSREIVGVRADGLDVRFGSGQVERYDTAFNFLPQGKSQRARVLALSDEVGDEWRLSREFDNPGVEKEIVETTTFDPYNPAASGTTTRGSELLMFVPGK